MTMSLLRHNNIVMGSQRLKRYVLRRLWKTGSDCADVMCCGRLFQTWTPATKKARSLTSALWFTGRGFKHDRASLLRGLWQDTYTCVPLSPFAKTYNLVPAKGQLHSVAGKVRRQQQVWHCTGHASQTKWYIHLQALGKGRETSTLSMLLQKSIL